MNDEQRAALVEELENLFAWSWGRDLKTGRQVLAELGDDPARYYRRETVFANKVVEIFDRAATAAEPDDDVVERAAKAMYFTDANPDPVKYDRVSAWREEWEKHLAFYQSEGYDPEGFFPVFMLAKKALAAVPSCADDNWLDDALDSVHPKAVVYGTLELRKGGWEASVTAPDGPDENGWYDYTGNQVRGEGTTRREAILDACAKAKEASK